MKLKLTHIASIFLALIITCATASAVNQRVAIIVNKDNPVTELTHKDIKNIYRNTTLTWPGGTAIIIYDLSLGDP
ncbi:MAG: hypothetical protein V3T30_01850, partial [Thermodesulfobacteriota bacterium]